MRHLLPSFVLVASVFLPWAIGVYFVLRSIKE